MGTSSHPRAPLAQGGRNPHFAGHSAAVAGALREARCTSPTKITAVPTPHWQRSPPRGIHIPAPGMGSPDGLAGFPRYRRWFPLIQRKLLRGGRKRSVKAGSASRSPAPPDQSPSRCSRHAGGWQGPWWAQYPPPQPRVMLQGCGVVPVLLAGTVPGGHSPGQKLFGGARRRSPPARGGGPGSSSQGSAPRAGGGSGRRGHGAAVGGTGPPHSSGRARGAGEPRRGRRSPEGTAAPLASPAACSRGDAPGSTQRRGQQSQGGQASGGHMAGPRRGGEHPGAQGQGPGKHQDHPPGACHAGAALAGCSPQRTGGGQRRAGGQPHRCPVVESWGPPAPGHSPPAHGGWVNAVAAACAPGTSASGPGLLASPARGTGALWGLAAGQGWRCPGPLSGRGSCHPRFAWG